LKEVSKAKTECSLRRQINVIESEKSDKKVCPQSGEYWIADTAIGEVNSGLFLNKGRFKTDKEIQAALLG